MFAVVCEDSWTFSNSTRGFLNWYLELQHLDFFMLSTDFYSLKMLHNKWTANLQCNLVCLHLGYKYGKYLFSVCDAVSALIRACLVLQLLVLHLCSCHSDTIAAAQCFPSLLACLCVIILLSYCSLTLLHQHLLPACLPLASATSESAWVC